MPLPEFYLRLHIGQTKEYLEVEVQADGELRYTNKSQYRGEAAIRKRLYVSPTVVGEIARIVREAGATDLDDGPWPRPNRDGCQELEVRMILPGSSESAHVSLATAKLASTVQIARCCAEAPGGGGGGEAAAAALKRFFFLCQDLKALFLALVAAHFQVQPI